MFKKLESVVLFVADIDAAAAWYAQLLGTEVQQENAHYAFVQGPGLLIGFHPADRKCPGGVGGTTVYWEWPTWARPLSACRRRAPGCTGGR
ncbi:VOC family protein [Comamonas sp.]|uniref:VOC family protein n=1 Tax=Comamonas sp. TaxID=34028 RepID=UPI0028ACBE3B|nr:VOC family protein [Comamonas sp.]